MASKCLVERWLVVMIQILRPENYARVYSKEEFTSLKCGLNLGLENNFLPSQFHVFGSFDVHKKLFFYH